MRIPWAGVPTAPPRVLAWLVKQKRITPHIPVFDHSNRTDGTFSRADFAFDPQHDRYTCPAGKELVQFRRNFSAPRTGITSAGTRLYRAGQKDCGVCELKARCCPNTPARKIPRALHEDARDAARALALTPEYEAACKRRKKVEMLFAHLKRISRLGRLRLRGPCGAKDEFLLAATAQNLKKACTVETAHPGRTGNWVAPNTPRGAPCSGVSAGARLPSPKQTPLRARRLLQQSPPLADFPDGVARALSRPSPPQLSRQQLAVRCTRQLLSSVARCDAPHRRR